MPTLTTGTPEWWRERLGKRLDERHARMQMFQDYYDGRQPLAFASNVFLTQYGDRFRQFADNFCPLVVEAVEERLAVIGFRMGSSRDLAADKDAWRIWQANQMDAQSELAHREALIKGCAYVIVSPFAADMVDATTPLVTIEDPMEVALESEPGNRRRKRAALKRWKDDEGFLRAVLWLPGELYRWRSVRPYRGAATGNVQWAEFSLPEDGEGGFPIRLRTISGQPFDEIPVIALPNRPLRDGSFDSEISGVIALQNAINKTAADALVASQYAAHRQKNAINLDLEADPVTGIVKNPYVSGPDQMWVAGTQPVDEAGNRPPPVQFGQFDVSDLSQYVKIMEMWVQHMATQTRTPAHYLLGQSGTFPSGESLQSTETGLTAKARQKMRHFGEGWEEVPRLAFLFLDDERAKVVDSETIWRDPETRSESEHIDALVKKKAIGVPDQQLQEDAGYTPQQIARFKDLLASQPKPPTPVVVPTVPPAVAA